MKAKKVVVGGMDRRPFTDWCFVWSEKIAGKICWLSRILSKELYIFYNFVIPRPGQPPH